MRGTGLQQLISRLAYGVHILLSGRDRIDHDVVEGTAGGGNGDIVLVVNDSKVAQTPENARQPSACLRAFMGVAARISSDIPACGASKHRSPETATTGLIDRDEPKKGND